MNVYRILDAEINRVSEGIRCVEDTFRFLLENRRLSKELKELRHKIRKLMMAGNSSLIFNRNVEDDPGLKVSQSIGIDDKYSIKDTVYANFKRCQEGLRSIEEVLKIVGEKRLSKQYELLRFCVYNIEKECITELMKLKRFNPLNTDLYCLTGEKFSKGRSNKIVVSEMIRAGVKVIQYREKEKTLLEKYRECKIIREMTEKEDVTFIINDDIDLAQIVDADGVHIGQNDFPPIEVRKIIGENKIIGLSTHSPEQGVAAVKAGVDYIGVGPIYPTNTKENVCSAVGLEYLDWVVENLKIPFVAIGGIKKHNLDQVVNHGASCVAMVTEILEAKDVGSTISKIKKSIYGRTKEQDNFER